MPRKPDRAVLRCAIYTRKSTEEGLEQAYNSLDAQRDACAAYINSQVHEGWVPAPTVYDDGGYSGGNLDRPGIAQLLKDVRSGKIDIIVVYKVDRLTRSLADFAKIVEVLDKQGASFVSVTQAFNTTTSMGRLTLNVLLSFAQFEREVTGERIRDKIAASKARGIWMGGVVPLGYQVLDCKLLIVPDEATLVRSIFTRYLELRSVLVLARETAAQGIFSRVRISRSGRQIGGQTISRGSLYLMLRNRIYLGEIVHKGTAFPGEHEALIDRSLFEQVGDLLNKNSIDHASAIHADQPSLLCGLVWDSGGRRMPAEHTTKKNGMRYRYYVSQKAELPLGEKPRRVPAGDLEQLVVGAIRHEGVDPPLFTRLTLAGRLSKIVVHENKVEIHLSNSADLPLIIPVSIIRRGFETRLSIERTDLIPARPDAALIKLVVNAHRVRAATFSGAHASVQDAADALGYRRDYCAVLLRIGFLAPDIVTSILEGRQPAYLNRQRLARMSNLPIDWGKQREMLGFSTAVRALSGAAPADAHQMRIASHDRDLGYLSKPDDLDRESPAGLVCAQ